jgi:hypothetical protein
MIDSTVHANAFEPSLRSSSRHDKKSTHQRVFEPIKNDASPTIRFLVFGVFFKKDDACPNDMGFITV